MAIELTTPFVFKRGHGLPDQTCNHVKIVGFGADTANKRRFWLIAQYGNIVDGVFTAGYPAANKIVIEDTDAIMAIDPDTHQLVEATPADPAYTNMVDASTVMFDPTVTLTAPNGTDFVTLVCSNPTPDGSFDFPVPFSFLATHGVTEDYTVTVDQTTKVETEMAYSLYVYVLTNVPEYAGTILP